MRFLNFIFFIIFVTTLLVLPTGAGHSSPQGISIVPLPADIEEGKEEFVLVSRGTRIIADEKVSAEANYLSELLGPYTVGMQGKSGVSSTGKAIFLKLDGDRATLGNEGYTLSVTTDRIEISAAAPAGIFYGIQTLRQLIPPEIEKEDNVAGPDLLVPCVEISDHPRFEWRGIMIDPARHFLPVDFVLKLIDVMALYKFNRLHIHLTDDQGWRLEIKKYPELTEIGSKRGASSRMDKISFEGATGAPHSGFYTQDDIRRIVQYAETRCITVVPEIEMPGHSTAALASVPGLGCTGKQPGVRTKWGISKDIYCAGSEKTFEFLEDVLGEVADLFPGEYIHIGGDEAPKDRWRSCPKCQARIKSENLKDEDELQSWFVARIEKFINSRGKKLIGWDEILRGGLPPRAIVMSWHGTEGGEKAAMAGHDVVMAPRVKTYLNLRYSREDKHGAAWLGILPFEDAYAFDPVPDGMGETEAAHILGVHGSLWGEFLPTTEKLEEMAFPRALAVAEVGWTPGEKKDWEDFQCRLDKQLDRLEALGVNYRKEKPGAVCRRSVSSNTMKSR